MFCRAPLFWLALLVVGWRVEGAPDCAPASKLLTIKTSQDVTDLSTCTTFTGDVVVAADGPSDIALDGIKTISGNVDIENVAKLRSLSSTSLEVVSSFTLNNLQALEKLEIPSLKTFSSLKWSTLPKLTDCKVATGAIEGDIQEITIYNTSLKDLDWLIWPIGATLNITANPNLETFKLPYSAINVGSAITLTSNPALSSFDASSLRGIYGGLAISKNKIDTLSFDSLEAIGGFVQLSGDYTNITMSTLDQVIGAINVESTKDIDAFCDSLKEKKLGGHYDCTSNTDQTTASSSSENPSSSSPTPTPSSSPSAAAEQGGGSSNKRVIAAGAVVGIVITLLVGLGVFLYMRRQARKRKAQTEPKDPEADSIELSISDRRTSLQELESPVIRLEMASGRMMQELPAVIPAEMDGHRWGDGASVRSVNSTAPLIRHELPG